MAKVSGVGLERKRRKSNVFGGFKERRERLVEGGPKVRGGCLVLDKKEKETKGGVGLFYSLAVRVRKQRRREEE